MKLAFYIQPQASKSEIVGLHGDGSIKVRIHAPPVDGEANDELIRFLAKLLKIKKNQIEITAGHSSRKKILHFIEVDEGYIRRLLGLH